MEREGFAGLITLPANAALSPPSTAGASRKAPVGVDAGAERTTVASTLHRNRGPSRALSDTGRL